MILIFALLALNLFFLYKFLTITVPPRLEEPGISARDQEVIRSYHRIFYRHKNGVPANTWLGIRAKQNPNDTWITQEIISEVKPDFLIEAGTAAGGSAVYWATVLEQVNPQGRVITVDVKDMIEEARQVPIFQRRVDFLLGDSTSPEILAEVKRRVAGGSAMVILDSDHSKDHVLKELNLYSPLVSVGSYLIVQDTNLNGHPVAVDFGPGPMEALEEFLATNDQFEIDTTRERLLLTFHPRGYLRRVK